MFLLCFFFCDFVSLLNLFCFFYVFWSLFESFYQYFSIGEKLHSKMKKPTRNVFKVSIFLALLLVISSKINNNIFDAKIFLNKEIPISRLQAPGHRFSISQSDTTYQMSGDVYESQTIFEEKQIYNLSNYKKSQSCTYFKSVIEMNSIQGDNLNYIALQSLLSQQTNELFIIGTADQLQNNMKFLNVYNYTDQNFLFDSQLSFNNTELSQDINVQIYITKIWNTTLFSDGNFLYRLEKTITKKNQTNYNWNKTEGWNSAKSTWKGQQFLGFEKTTFQDKQLLLFLYTQKIIFYEYDEVNNRAKIYLQILNDGKQAFEDVQIGSNNSQIYALAGNQLLFYSLPDYKTPVKNELAGEVCNRIYMYTSTLHIICQFEKRNFIGEYFYNDKMNVLILNRFYNDIQNYRLISYINNYFLMVGENDIILTSNSVNRKILLDMPKNPYSQKFVSFGIQSLHLLKQSSDSNQNQVLFAVGQDFVVLFQLKFVPAEVWCYVERPPESLQKSIIIVRNTSQCQLNEKQQSLKSICINLKPVQIFFQQYEIESKLTSIFVIIVVLLAFVLAFLCLGCVFRENMNYNHLIVEIKRKIKKLQTKSSSHQMREI